MIHSVSATYCMATSPALEAHQIFQDLLFQFCAKSNGESRGGEKVRKQNRTKKELSFEKTELKELKRSCHSTKENLKGVVIRQNRT